MLAAVTAAPMPIQIGDNTYNASPLSLYQLGGLDNVVKAWILAPATSAAGELPRELGDRLIDRALEQAKDVSFSSPDTMRFLRTFRGTCTLLAMSLRQYHPEMTDAAIGAVLSKHADQTGPAVDVVLKISGLITDKPAAGKDGQKPGEAVGAA